MAQVIDSENDTREFFLGLQKVSTTLTLCETAPDQFGISYDSSYSGIYSGHNAGGPITVSQNGSWKVNDNPTITVSVSNYSDDKSNRQVSMHANINVDIIGVGTIYDKTLGGRYGIDTMKELDEAISRHRQRSELARS